MTFVYCSHRVQWILDIFACLDRWMSLLLTDNASPGSLDGMMPGFLVYRKIGNCSDITYFTYWESGLETRDTFVYQRCWHFYNRSCWRVFFSNLGRKCIISEEQFVLELPTSRAMLATARPSCSLCLPLDLCISRRPIFSSCAGIVSKCLKRSSWFLA